MNEDLLELRVVEIITETPDALTYRLQPVDDRPIAYRAGQFLTVILMRHGHEVRRSYSLSSTPGVDTDLQLTIKRVINGEISRYLIEHLRVGDVLTSLPPAGRFTLETNSENRRDIVLIGAGSGITPLYALLKQVLHEEPQSHVTLLYANSRERSIIFRNQLSEWHARYPERFQLLHLLSQPSDDWIGSPAPLQGRLNNTMLETLLPRLTHFDRSNALFYLCGPGDFMRMVQFTLSYLGIQAGQIRREHFVIVPVAETRSPANSEPHTIRLHFRGVDYDIAVDAYQTILQAALQHGIKLPYSCRGGRCSTCVARCQSGKVLMTINDVLTDKDIAEGWVLTCTGYPETDDVRIKV